MTSNAATLFAINAHNVIVHQYNGAFCQIKHLPTLDVGLLMANATFLPVCVWGCLQHASSTKLAYNACLVLQGQLVGVALSFLRNFGILSGASGVLGAISSGVASSALDDRFAVQRAQQKQVS